MLFLESLHARYTADFAEFLRQAREMIGVLHIHRHFAIEHGVPRVDIDGTNIGVVIAGYYVREVAQHSGTIFAKYADANKIIGAFIGARPGNIDHALLGI